MDKASFLKADEIGRRQFMINAAHSYLGVSVAPMLGASLATGSLGAKNAVKAKAEELPNTSSS